MILLVLAVFCKLPRNKICIFNLQVIDLLQLQIEKYVLMLFIFSLILHQEEEVISFLLASNSPKNNGLGFSGRLVNSG